MRFLVRFFCVVHAMQKSLIHVKEYSYDPKIKSLLMFCSRKTNEWKRGKEFVHAAEQHSQSANFIYRFSL